MRSENELLDKPDYQGNAVINYTERDIPYTHIIEHKCFDLNNKQTNTYIYKEYPSEYVGGIETILLSTN